MNTAQSVVLVGWISCTLLFLIGMAIAGYHQGEVTVGEVIGVVFFSCLGPAAALFGIVVLFGCFMDRHGDKPLWQRKPKPIDPFSS